MRQISPRFQRNCPTNTVMVGRTNSLLELKKLQWARERAEDIKNYGGIWGHFSDASEPRYRPCIRGINRSATDLKTGFDKTPPIVRRRTPSLPPIPSNQFEPLSPSGDDSGGGDTSGYASDSADFVMAEHPWKPNNWPHPGFGPRRTPESFSSGSGGREERAKWGERGVGVGHLWSPSVHLPGTLLPQIEQTTPSWIQRGLQEPAQVLVISHDESLPGSLANSHDMSRSIDTLSTTTDDYQRCFVRGQNVPIDPHVAAEKERKRQKAIEHQNAIKQQLEEKEKKKREEQEILEREEMMIEERLRRHHELEMQRLEEEKRRQKEKEEKDERVARALREAIEIAEKRAKEEKARARRKHLPPECRTPQPQVAAEPQKCGQPQVGGCGSASQKTTLRLESNQGNVEVIESRTVLPCQKKNEILVYHTEVVLKSPPPHRTPQRNIGTESPGPISPKRSGSATSEKGKSPQRSARHSPRARRSPDVRRSPRRDDGDASSRPELDLVPERETPFPRLVMPEASSQVENEGYLPSGTFAGSPQLNLQNFPTAKDNSSGEAKERDKEDSKIKAEIEQSGNTKSTEQVNRGVSPMSVSGSQSTSPSQDPPPPPKGSPFDKKLPSDALIDPASERKLKEQFTDPSLKYPPPPGTPELDDILTVAVQEFSIEESEVEVSRLCVVPSPTLARLLTPSHLRGGPYRAEVATQTETRASRPTRRNIRIEDRPKWGVNKPSTRYIKASDRYPFMRNRNNDTDDSRSPSPLNSRKSTSYTNFLPMARMRNSSVESTKPRKESKASNTPRLIQILPKPGIVRKNSAGRRYLSFKGGPRLLHRPQGNSVLPKKLDLTEIMTVKDVLSQLTSLKYGLKMKRKEWELSRSQTPFSDVSSIC